MTPAQTLRHRVQVRAIRVRGGSHARRIDWRTLRVPALICLLALGLRLLYLVFTGHTPLTSDALQYDVIARNLVAGRGFSARYPQLYTHETAFRPPLYPMLLAAFYWVFGPSGGLARGINVGLGVIVVGMTFYVVQRHISRTAAIWAAIAVAIMPNLIANDTFALDEPLALLLILTLLELLLRRKWVWSGVAVGALTLTRPSAQFLVLVLAVWLVIKVGWRSMLAMVLAAGLVVTPWVIRNWIQIGTPTIATSNGFNWSAIYSPPAEQAGMFVDPIYSPYFQSHRLLQFNEAQWSSYLQSVGVHNLKEHPTYVFHVVLRNTEAYFEINPEFAQGADAEDGRDLRIVSATLPIFYVELGVGTLGLLFCWRKELVRLLFLQACYFGAASLLFIAVPRLRAPIDLTLAVGVGCFAQTVGDWFRRRQAIGASTPALPDGSVDATPAPAMSEFATPAY
jgi:4-amino-4-deoxy-L-arabinose transferase-like glycosyltransferase